MRKFTLIVLLFSLLLAASSCRRRATGAVTVAVPDKFSTLDTLTTTASDASAERVKNLMFNALVKKDENFNYVGDLAREITTSPDGLTLTFVLRDGVKFHNGRDFTSADVKYTFDELFNADGYKAKAFFDTEPADGVKATSPTVANANKPGAAAAAKQVKHIQSLTTPDAKTVVITVAKPAHRNQLLSNLVAIPIIPEGSIAQQKESPLGSGPYKFVSYDASQNVLELAANSDYWDTPPTIQQLRLKTVTDATALQAELETGGIDIAPNPSNLPPDMLKALGGNANLKLVQSDGSNIQYLVLNVQSPPLDNPKIRQAIGYAVDRQKIVEQLLANQARVASSILPPESWAYTAGQSYTFDPAKAKQLLQEAGYKNEPIVFKYSAGNAMVNQYSQVIQSALNDIGLNVRIETLEVNTIRQQLRGGQFQMYTGVWIGGNQDPIFLRDLFSSTKITGPEVSCCNRSRYSSAEVDKTVADAINAADNEAANPLYIKTWDLVSADLPLMPLWYPANIVIANKRIGNIKMAGSGDWNFLKDVTVN